MNKKTENKKDLIKKTAKQKTIATKIVNKKPISKKSIVKKKETASVKKFFNSTRDLLFQTKEQEVKNGLFSVMKRRFFSVPISVRFISLSLFLFVFGRGLGGDIFFSIYIERIVQSVMLVSLIGMLGPIIKLLLVLQVGSLNDNTNRKYVVFLGKFFYVFSSIFYFLAGILQSPWLLIIAVLFNGIGSVLVYVTYEGYIRAT
ncbi:MAG TPA: MFS transporter, partial [Candidatus Absconditabacterales bacterium]|nr:MFS transporter [Candidatus Absconditabacterales bacterium]